MQSSLKRVLVGVSFFGLTMLVAVIGYKLAGWSWLDSIYMVVITVFGVGFGEIGPMSPALRVFTIFVIIAGCTSLGYIVTGFLQMITEGEIKRALGTRRMMREIDTLKNHVIICGYGRIGQILARKMQEAGQPFVLIDNNESRVVEAEAQGFLVRMGTAIDESVLESVGIMQAKYLATVLPDDAANVFITLTARSLNPDLVILSRGEYLSTERKLRQAGADRVVSPAAIGALRMAHMITHPAALELLDEENGHATLNELLSRINVQIDELAVTAHSNLIGATISDVQRESKGAFILVALQKADGSTIVNPGSHIALEEGDTIILMGRRGDFQQFAKQHALKRQLQYRGAKFSR